MARRKVHETAVEIPILPSEMRGEGMSFSTSWNRYFAARVTGLFSTFGDVDDNNEY